MLMRRISKKDKIPSGPLRKVAASGIAVGLAAASLNGIGTANGTCFGAFGIDIGDCTSTFGSFAFVLGDGTAAALGPFTAAIALGLNDPAEAESSGFFSLAYAGGANTFAATQGTLALAFVQATEATARAGSNATDYGNIGVNLGRGDPLSGSPDSSIVFAGNQVGAPNLFNLVVNTANTTEKSTHPTKLGAGGFASSAFNIGGEDNVGSALGTVNNVTNFFGAGNTLSSTSPPGQLGFNVAASFFTNDGVRDAGPGPFDIDFATPFNPNILSASEPNMFTPTTFAAGSVSGAGSQVSGALTNVGKQFSSSLNQISSSLSKAVNETVSRVTGGTSTKGK